MSAACIVVTGATRGIGRALVERLMARGESVVGIARSADPGFPAPLHTADLTDASDTARVLGAIGERHAVKGLVNNAGVNRMQALGTIDHAAFDLIVGLNCRAAIDCTQALLGSIRTARDVEGKPCGRIVNIASRSLLGRFEGSVYAAAKAAMVGLTRSWALELARDGVTVNCVAPGPVATEMFDANNPPGDPRRDRMLAAVPMQRMGEPAEIAAAVDFFLSPGAAFTTGQTLFVCGGSSISQIHL